MSSTNGSGPPRQVRAPALSRRSRLAIGAAAGLVILGVLVAPIIILTVGSGPAKSCALTLRYKSRVYVARTVLPVGIVQGIAIGVGETSGCGSSPANIGIRTLLGVRTANAVALGTDQSSIYVRRGLCTKAVPRVLLGCLKRAT